MTFRQVCRPAPRKVSGALPTRSPFSAASASRRLPCARRTASGFSEYTDLPAFSAASATFACAFGTVRFRTMLISGSRRSLRTEQALGILNSAALAFARAAIRSAHAATSRFSNIGRRLR